MCDPATYADHVRAVVDNAPPLPDRVVEILASAKSEAVDHDESP